MPKAPAPHFAKLTTTATKPRPAARHSKIEQVTVDVYMVRGKMPSAPGRPLFERLFLYYSRTMTIVRQRNTAGEYELTLINTLRLNKAKLAELSKLGTVRHIVRLGSFHGADDGFYLSCFDATYWNVKDMENPSDLWLDPEVLTDTNLPLKDCKLFKFDNLPYPEAILVLSKNEHRPGLAITTDSIQNHRSAFDIDNAPLVSLVIWRIGLLGKARLGPVWLREQAPAQKPLSGEYSREDKLQSMSTFFRPQFEKLMSEFDFEMLIPGHGWPIYQDAKQALQINLDDQLPNSN